jgi:hypothetical protein
LESISVCPAAFAPILAPSFAPGGPPAREVFKRETFHFFFEMVGTGSELLLM